MGRAILEVTPQLLASVFKPSLGAMVVDFGLPHDATVLDVRYIKSRNIIGLEIESESFNEPVDERKLPVLPTPQIFVVEEEDITAIEPEQSTGDDVV
jgi:hypothetical protein